MSLKYIHLLEYYITSINSARGRGGGRMICFVNTQFWDGTRNLGKFG